MLPRLLALYRKYGSFAAGWSVDCKPLLEQGSGRRYHKKRQPDRQEKQKEQPWETGLESNGRESSVPETHGQRDHHQQQQKRNMQESLPPHPEAPCGDVGVDVTGE